MELINYDKRIFRRMERCTRIYRLLPYGTRRTGQPLDTGSPIFAVYHDTGNPDSTAQQNVNYYKNTYLQDWASTASAHFFVDDEECIICIPLDESVACNL